MSRVVPEPSRVTVRREGGRLLARMAVRRNWLVAIFLAAWLGGWGMGEVFAARQVFAGEVPLTGRAFLAFWLVGWTVGGMFVLLQLAWSVMGREEIAVDGRSLTVRWVAGPFRRTREYDLGAVRNLRRDDTIAASLARSYRKTSPGRHGVIAFDHGAKTIRFGADLEGEDVEKVLSVVREAVPGPDSW